MSQTAENLEKIHRVANMLTNAQTQEILKNIDLILPQIQKIPETSRYAQERNMDLLNQRQHVLEQKINALENEIKNIKSKLSKHDSSEIEVFTKKIFSKIPTIKKIYIRSTQSGFILITIHTSKTISNAIEQIQPGLVKLEDEFPDTYFEPWILRSHEVQEEHLQQSKMIFER